MEIERKWLVSDWPPLPLPLLFEQSMRQGYISVHPTVRIREEAIRNGETDYILCFKSSGSGNGADAGRESSLVRKEIEMAVSKDMFMELEDLIGIPLIPKVRRTYALPDGLTLEVNHVDEGLPSEFWYAEVEFESVEQALNWDPAQISEELASYLRDDVTDQPGQTMGAFWSQTRLGQEPQE
ncbi:MAG: hypothetical protein Q4F25_02620 [Eubacteriales bacterium]|nr:hypothetical protein [Eubacteriales bacterium]